MSDHRKPWRRSKDAPPWLDGHVFCAACGYRLYLMTSRRHDPEINAGYRSFRCGNDVRWAVGRTPTRCPGAVHSRKATRIDEVCRALLARDLSTPLPLEEAQARVLSQARQDGSDRRVLLDHRRADLERRARVLLDALEEGNLASNLYRERTAAIARDLERNAAELETLPAPPSPVAVRDAWADVAAIGQTLDRADDASLRAIVTRIGARFTVDLGSGKATVEYAEPYSTIFGGVC